MKSEDLKIIDHSILNSTSIATETKKQIKEANVLYQKLGAKWFAFAEVEGEIYMNSVDEMNMSFDDDDDSSENSAAA